MPCYDPRVDDDNKENARKVQVLTRLLCEACTALEAHGAFSEKIAWKLGFSSELLAWRLDHKVEDEKRKAE